jgi:hypothetical protein
MNSAAAAFLFADFEEAAGAVPGAAQQQQESPPLVATPDGHGSLTLQQLEEIEAQRQADEQEQEEARYEARPLKTRKRERKVLGKPGKRSTCFLCAYVGERDTVLPSDDVAKIVEMLRENCGKMDPAALATQVADYYAKLRARVNRQLQAGETPLPHMNAATVLEHIRSHQQDAEVKQLTMLAELQELRETLMDSVLEENKRTKHVRGNLSQISALERIIKLELLVHSKDASKMACYSAGARVNPSAHKQGAAHVNTKTIYDYWRPH